MENKLVFWMLTLGIGILAFAACKPRQTVAAGRRDQGAPRTVGRCNLTRI